MSLLKELWVSLPNSTKCTISQHNHQYQANTAQQDNAGCIPTALWEQLPPHAKSAISNAQHHSKQQTNSTTAHSNDHTDHSIADTLPMYTSNSVHHLPMETNLSPEFTTLLKFPTIIIITQYH